MTLTKELKIAFGTIVALTIMCALLLVIYIEESRNLTNPFAAQIKGDQEQVQIEEPREFQPLKPAPNKEKQVKTTSPLGTFNSTSENYSLSGNGCNSNDDYPNSCGLNNPQGQTLQLLKDCNIEAEESNTCNLYTYSLGKEINNGIYIFQSFQEGTQELTDVFFYNSTNTEYTLVDTVLFENISEYQDINLQDVDIDPNSLQNKVNENNQKYLETINEYR